MSDTARHALIFAVSLILTIGICYIGITIYQRSEAYAKSVQKQQDQSKQAYEEYEITKYDGRTPYGSEVITYIKKMISEYELSVTLKIGSNTYAMDDSTYFAEFYNPAASHYIDPYKKYLITVLRNTNDIIYSVTVVQQ